jgi:PAS domain S-box-containing protein
MAWLRDLPIKRRLTRVILLTCTVALLLACAVLAAYELFDFRRAMARDMTVVADVLAMNIQAALAFEDEAAAGETLSALRAEPYVMSAWLQGADGKLFTAYHRPGISDAILPAPMPDGHRFEGGFLFLSRPVVLKGKRIGTIRIQADLQGIDERLLLFGGIAGLVLLGSLGVALAVSNWLQRPISGPILELAETARAVAERKDYTVRARPQGANEVGVLTEAFNQMLTGIEEREKALREGNQSLTAEIAERTRAEGVARQSEERYRTLFDTLIEGFCTIEVIFDAGNRPVDYRFLEINPAFEKQTGMQNAQGKRMRELVPNHEEHWFELYGKIALTGESAHFENEAQALGKWFEVFAYRIGGPESRKVAILFGDITDRKLAEGKVRSQLARLELMNHITRAIGERQDLTSIFQVSVGSIEEHLPVDFSCACLYDEKTGYLTVSSIGPRHQALALDLALGPAARIEIARNGLDNCVNGQLVYEPDIARAALPFPEKLASRGLRALVMAPLLVERKVFGVIIAARRQAESFTSAECEFIRQLSEHVALAAHQAQLHGELQSAYDELRETQQSALQQERLRALGQMASGIAHDINNAISPAALYTESLLEAEPGLSPRARKYLGTIQHAIEDVAQTVARMREFYRQREPQLLLAPIQLNGLVQQVVDLSRARWSDIPQQKGVFIEMVVEAAPDLPPVMGIEGEIREALINLIFNAVDAMPEGGRLTLRTGQVPDQSDPTLKAVTVEVSDTGGGMDEDTRRRCLEPFFTTKGERGTGLGLAMVYGVVQRHGAQMEIDSTLGQGTTARINFGSPRPAPIEAAPEPVPQVPSRLRILVVDDDPLLIRSLRDVLEIDGHTVVSAEGGQAGIDALHQSVKGSDPFSLVITDLGMPHVDGRKVAQAVKTASPNLPVILFTGWGQRLIAEGDIPPHVDRVLSKPPKLQDLRLAMAAVLSERA